MDDDFEDAFADELDALRELEDDFYQQSQPVKKPISSSQANKKQQNETKKNFQSSDLPSLVNGKAPPQDDDWDVPDDLLADADAFAQAEATSTADALSSKADEGLEERQSRKRDVRDLFGDLSDDSESELVIDAPIISSPQAKRARKLFSQEKAKGTEDVKKSNKDSQTKDPLDDFEITPPSSPTAEEKALLKVQMHRARVHNNAARTSVQQVVPTVTNLRGGDLFSRQRVLKRQPAGAFVSVTTQDGRRVYLKKTEKILADKGGEKKNLFKPMPLQLLATSMGTLKMQIERERHQRIIREAERISSQVRDRNNVQEMRKDDDSDDEESAVKKSEPGLWVDRYAPKRYTELLSDDGVNRNLLFWLKLWDQVVFNKEKAVSTRTKRQENKPQNFKNKWQQQQAVIEELDEHNRPVHKVALLCGPPGLGKTTLAHVIAQHAGYNVVEMNASDDRSQDVFRTRIENAIQIKSVLNMDNRPNCLVIDEIDGAPAPAINVLLGMIKRTDGNPNSKKKKKQSLLMRPIICICNDPYVPALRQLRQLAFITHFPPTLSARLASRLQQIAKNNALRADMTSLMALCIKADNDIRSCLNTLQFLHSQRTALSLRLVHSLSVGQKDKHKGLFTVWQDIFQLPKAKRKQYANPHDVHEGLVPALTNRDNTTAGIGDEINPTSLTGRFYNILQTVQAEGEYEKLMQGVFDNFLDARFKDPHLESVNLSYDWLGFSDLLQTQINHSQNYIFMRYLPFTPVTFHMLFASISKPQIKYPNTQYEVKTKLGRNMSLITTLLSEVHPRIASSLNPRTLLMDILSHLLLIIQPSFRPVNTQLFSAQEKKQMLGLIDTMIAYNLTYHQERNAEGQYNYVLDPNIEEVVRFSGAPPVKQMTYSSKQLIAREISLEKMRRTEKSVRGNQKNQNSKQKTKTEDPKGAAATADPSVPRHKEKLKPKKIVEDKPARDFFGRLIPTNGSQEKQEGSTATTGEIKQEKRQLQTSKLWYKFNEGFSNAVRQNIRIQDLL